MSVDDAAPVRPASAGGASRDRSLTQQVDDSAKRIDFVFPRFKLLSGAERAILGLAEALVRGGHAVRIVCHQFDDSCRPRLADGVELVVSGARLDFSRNRYVNAVFDYGRTLKLGRLLDPEADARVHFGPALLLARRHLKRSRAAGIPSIYYCWEPPRVLYQDRGEVLDRLGWLRWPMAAALAVYAGVDRRMVMAVDQVVTSSPFAARRIEEIYGRPAGVITLGIDRRRLDAARERQPADPPRLLTVNYLHPRKRVDLIVRGAAELDGQLVAAAPVLTIVGDGPEKDRLKELAKELGIADRVVFAGFVPDEELPRYYGEATCYVHATRDESFGLSVIEASYCGLPVVAVDEGGVKDTVEDGTTGYRVAATPASIAAGIARVLASPDRGKGLGEAGRRNIDARFRWSRGAEDLLEAARSKG